MATLSLVMLMSPDMNRAQTTDITPSGLNTTVGAPTPLPNGMINYDISGGSRPGNGPNLFHSFGEFSVGANHIANFLNETATPTTNILSRVTGGNPSNIFGTLQTTDFGAANLYLINPAGVIFGPTASLNVGGSFAASTADYLKMTDGAKFSANPAQATVLSIAPVVAFGFLNGNPAPISIQRSVGGYLGGADLSVPTGTTMSFVGGDLTLTAEPILGQNGIPAVSAPSGVIQLASMKGPGEVPANLAEFNMSTAGPLGVIALSQGALVSASSDASGRGGGTVVLRGGILTLDNASIFADTLGSQNGALLAIDAHLTGNVVLTNGAGITADLVGAGHPGKIQVSGNKVEISNGAVIASRAFPGSTGDAGILEITASEQVTLSAVGAVSAQSFGAGKGGDIRVSARTIILEGGAQIDASAYDSGAAGSIDMKATDPITITGRSADGSFPTGLFANTNGTELGAGKGGDIEVSAQNISILGGAAIESTTSGPGVGGTISVTATESLVVAGSSMDGTHSSAIRGAAQGFGPDAGNGGSIVVAAKNIDLEEGGQIGAGTFGPGAGGSLSVTAAENLTIKGERPGGFSSGLFVNVDNTDGRSSGTGKGGDLTVVAKNIVIEDAGEISSTTFGPGTGGSVSVTASETLNIAGGLSSQGGGIFAESRASGKTGDITVAAKNITVAGGGQISAATRGSGAGGTLDVKAVETLTVTGADPNGNASALSAKTFGTGPDAGKGADLVVTAKNLTVAENAEISGTTSGAGAGGTVSVAADNSISILTNGFIGSQSKGAGSAGNVTLLTKSFSDRNGGVSTIAFSTGNGGTIVINAEDVEVAEGGFIAAAAAGSGKGGTVSITASESITVSGSNSSGDTSIIFSSALGLGNAGNITLNAPRINLDQGGLVWATTISSGMAGSITANVGSLTLDNGAAISGSSSGQLLLTGQTSGAAGSVLLNANTVTLSNGAEISSSSTSFAANAGNAGQIVIQGSTGPGSGATSVNLDNSAISTRISGGGTSTTPATIDITAQTVNLMNSTGVGGGVIQADTSGAAPAGGITLNVGTLTAGNSSISSSSSSNDSTAGNAGSIVIQGLTGSGNPAASVSLDASGISTTISGGTSTSTPATITITAQTLDLDNFAQIGADTSDVAPAGDIALNVGTLTAANSTISSSSFSTGSAAGNAGSITIQGSTGSGSPAATVGIDRSVISTEISGGSADTPPGTITITAHTLTLGNRDRIGANTGGAAPAGDITLNVGTLTAGFLPEIVSGTAISSSSFFSDFTAGNAGSITIQGITGSGSRAANVRLDGGVILTQTSGGTAASTPGTIRITTQTLALTNEVQIGPNDAQIGATSYGAAPAGDIVLNVSTLTAGNNSIISSDSNFIDLPFFPDLTGGKAGSITIQGITGSGSPAANVSLDGGTISTTIGGGTSSTTPATIDITAQTVNLTNGAQISADTSGAAPGGSITLTTTESIALTGGSRVLSDSLGGTGNAGDVSLTAPQIKIEDGTFVNVNTYGDGLGGRVTISSSNSLLVAGVDAIIASATFGAGNAGEVTLSAPTITITDGATVTALTIGAGQAGAVTLQAAQLNITNGGTVDSTTIETGQGGTVTITATEQIRLAGQNDESRSAISVLTGGSGDAGQILVTTPVLDLQDAVIIAATEGSGNAGSITVKAGQLSLTNGASIDSHSTQNATGDAGSVNLQVSGLFSSQASTVLSTASQGAGGNVLITGGNVQLTDHTRIDAATTGSKNAGSIALTSATDLLMRESRISTSAAQASGGSIKLTAPNLIRLVDSTITSSVQGQAGSNGGNITIDPQLVVIQNSQFLANANAGAGGIISIAASGAVLVDPNSVLSASAGPAGVSGSVSINAPIQVLSGALVPLNLVYSQAGLSGDRCAADPKGQFSSFVQTGRDGVPQVPGALSPSPLSFLDTLTSGSLESPLPNLAAARLGLKSVSADDSALFRFHSACRS